MKTNISTPLTDLSGLLTCIAQPARIQILVSLGAQEACVCHLETVLEMSQASISQHLMILRKNGLVNSRRDGRHIYYMLSNPTILEVLRNVAKLKGIEWQPLGESDINPVPGCPCPKCNPELEPKLVCKKIVINKN